MARVKENAKRVVIIMAVIAFAFSSVAITMLYFIDARNQQEKQKLLQDLQTQNNNCEATQVSDKKVNPAPTVPQNPAVAAIPELKTEDLAVGNGAEVKEGDCVLLFYHGTLAKDGKAFQGGSNYSEGIPYKSATTGFIEGFSKGIVGMKVGGERRVLIPAAQAYGNNSQGEIPPNSDLIFTVKVTEVQTK